MEKINEAIKVFKEGGIVIYPTDTAFGIGCRIDNEEAVERLFKIRKRPSTMAVPVLFDSVSRVEEYTGEIEQKIREELLNRYWPGALTVVLNCKQDKVPSLVRGGGQSLGVRIPDHVAPLALISGAEVPLLGPSANFHGEKTPFRVSDINQELIKLVDFVLEGETKGNITSTVIDCTKMPWEVLREGAVKIE